MMFVQFRAMSTVRLVLLVSVSVFCSSRIVNCKVLTLNQNQNERLSTTSEIFIDDNNDSNTNSNLNINEQNSASTGIGKHHVQHLPRDEESANKTAGGRQKRSDVSFTYNQDDDYEFSEPVLKSISHKLVTVNPQSPHFQQSSIQVSHVTQSDDVIMSAAKEEGAQVEGKALSSVMATGRSSHPPSTAPILPPITRSKLEEAKIKQRIRRVLV